MIFLSTFPSSNNLVAAKDLLKHPQEACLPAGNFSLLMGTDQAVFATNMRAVQEQSSISDI
jgi:hypothetical protein